MPAPILTEAASRIDHPVATDASYGEVLLAAYEGYWNLVAAGAEITPEEYCERFPALRSSLPELLRAHAFLDEHQSSLAVAGTPEPASEWPEAGDEFLDFELRRELGRGAFSRVFLATQATLGHRWVAVKVCKKPMGEARILGPLSHPNIVPINSLQVDPQRRMAAICMQYAGSSTLQRLLDIISTDGMPTKARVILQAAEDTAAPPALKEELSAVASAEVLQRGSYVDGVCHLAMQLADALAFIHKRGIYHRDLKPSNVLLKPDGQPMLLDFNLSDEADKPMARMGGTLPYMSPEQLRAWRLCHQRVRDHAATPVSEDRTIKVPANAPQTDALPEVAAQSDLFSLGVILYEMLTGQHPFGPIPVQVTIEKMYELVHDGHQRGFKPLRQLCPDIDAALAALVERCLAHDVKLRPQTADEIVVALRERLDRTRRQRNRRRLSVAVAICLFLATAGSVGAFVGHRMQPGPNEELREAIKNGDYYLALDKSTAILDREPDNIDVRFIRARISQWLGQWKQTHLIDATLDYGYITKKVNNGRALACMAYCRQLMSQIQHTGGAIDYYSSAVKAGYNSAIVQNNLGRAYVTDGNIPAGKKCFDAAIALDPRFAVALRNRALAALNLFYMSPDKDETHLRQGMKDVADGLAVEASADLYYAGAMLHAVAARSHAEESAQAINYLAKAIQLGHSKVDFNDSSFRAIAHLPEFQRLADLKPETKYQRMPLIVDPLRGEGPIY